MPLSSRFAEKTEAGASRGLSSRVVPGTGSGCRPSALRPAPLSLPSVLAPPLGSSRPRTPVCLGVAACAVIRPSGRFRNVSVESTSSSKGLLSGHRRSPPGEASAARAHPSFRIPTAPPQVGWSRKAGPPQALDGWGLRPASPDPGTQRPLLHGTPLPVERATDQHPLGQGTSTAGGGASLPRGWGSGQDPLRSSPRPDQPSCRGSPPEGALHLCAWGPGA